jgi:hypothetical protein
MSELQTAPKTVQDLVARVIAKYFSDADGDNFDGKPVVALYRLDKWESGGKVTRGHYKKLTPEAKALCDPELWAEGEDPDGPAEVPPHAVVVLNKEVWTPLDDKTKTALIHHELMHEFGKHDVTEFLAVVQEHGLWDDGLKDIGVVANQQLTLDLGLDGEADPDVKVTMQVGDGEPVELGSKARARLQMMADEKASQTRVS